MRRVRTAALPARHQGAAKQSAPATRSGRDHARMQGTAADIIKRAMITVDAGRVSPEAGTRLIMQVHDHELVLEVEEPRGSSA